jgi:hypothetical protein
MISLIKKDVPRDAQLLVTPDLYAIPYESGHRKFLVTTWFPEQEDICGSCYVVIPDGQYRLGDYIDKQNLYSRRKIYSGPAFPGAGDYSFPIVLLAPEGNRSLQ